MKIAIFGNGKMGKLISKIAKERGHHINAVSNSSNSATNIDLQNIDVAIDFSTPDTAFENIMHAINNDTPIISGTTNWLKKYEQVKKACIKSNGAFLYASNFSLGMNILFKLNKNLANLIKNYNYENIISESHHLEKLDSPSGTAITLRENIEEILQKKIEIKSNRTKNIIGTHSIKYTSDIDEIEIIHTAKSREGFATGAIIAAEWIINKKGVFSFEDII
jgi:4-hydroxy-tetrahydrodipicolinate reductase